MRKNLPIKLAILTDGNHTMWSPIQKIVYNKVIPLLLYCIMKQFDILVFEGLQRLNETIIMTNDVVVEE